MKTETNSMCNMTEWASKITGLRNRQNMKKGIDGVRNEKTCHGKSMKKERDQNKGSKKQNGERKREKVKTTK